MTGIDAVNAYVGSTFVSVEDLFDARGLDRRRLPNLMMRRKSVNLPCEDPVTNAVNAAAPLVAALDDPASIEFLVVGTESGLDFGKPISTYVHDQLGLDRHCRSFEVKHACYGGTAALQTAAAFVDQRPDAKALVIAADASSAAARGTYWEPSQGAGAVAMVVGSEGALLALEPGANGYYSHEVMDTLRPRPDVEDGDSDLSLLSYLECLEQSFRMYCERVPGTDVATSFDALVWHTPFAGMVKGAHRQMMRRFAALDPAAVAADYERRVAGGLDYCSEVGNIYSAALYLALCCVLDRTPPSERRRLGLFSYGSGCASEFYSGRTGPGRRPELAKAIADRRPLAMDEYELLSDLAVKRMCGVRDEEFHPREYEAVYRESVEGRGLLVLDRIERYHRRYRWS